MEDSVVLREQFFSKLSSESVRFYQNSRILLFLKMWVLAVWPRLDPNSWAQEILLPHLQEKLGLQTRTNSTDIFMEINKFGRARWFMRVLPSTREVEIGRMEIQGQSRQKVSEILSKNKLGIGCREARTSRTGWWECREALRKKSLVISLKSESKS
jgi:hypothetical protein